MDARTTTVPDDPDKPNAAPDGGDLVVVQLWGDEEIGGRIYLQACNLFTGAILKGEHGTFMDHAMSVMHTANKEAWIGRVVDWKDTVSHFKALKHFRFEFLKREDGTVATVAPRFEGMETREVLARIYSNNLQYQQDFMAFALALKAPGLGLVPTNAEADPNPSWRYVKWGWGMIRHG